MKEVYLFDMDGTLADSMQMAWGVLPLQFLDERGISYPDTFLKDVVALGVAGLIRYYKERLHVKERAEEICRWFIQRGKALYESEIPAKPFAKQLLLDLKAKGASVNILTGSPHAFLDTWIKLVGFDTIVDNAWSVDDFPFNKANPELYLHIASNFGVAPSACTLLDDSIVPIETAKKAGCKTIAVYDEISKNAETEMRAVADRYIYSFKELL